MAAISSPHPSSVNFLIILIAHVSYFQVPAHECIRTLLSLLSCGLPTLETDPNAVIQTRFDTVMHAR